MSYDLSFWQYKKDVYLNNETIYKKCSNDEILEGLETLPTELILQDIKQEFELWLLDKNYLDFENPKSNGAFQITMTNQFVRFDCYQMQGEDMNKIIDIMDKYNCPLYDPQVPQRYDKIN